MSGYIRLHQFTLEGRDLKLNNSVCPHPLLQFLQFFQFMSDRLHQVTPAYIRLCQFTSEGRDVELDNYGKLWNSNGLYFRLVLNVTT